jgi:hypothetical protein
MAALQHIIDPSLSERPNRVGLRKGSATLA